jgi:hypothetical protein
MDDPSRPYLDAERTFAALEQQRLSGEITEQGYKEALNALRVRDGAGHTWMLQERTGDWYVYRSGAWAQATPPGRESAAPAPAPPPVAASFTPPAPAAAARSEASAPLPPVYSPLAATTPVYPAVPTAYQTAPPAYPTPPVYQAAPPVYAVPAQPAAYPPPPPAASIAPPPPAYTLAPTPVAATYAGPVPPQQSAPTRRSGRSRRYQPSGYRPGCLKVTFSIIKWEILWAVVGWVVYSAVGQRSPWVLIPVALVALTLMALYLRRFGRSVSEGARP